MVATLVVYYGPFLYFLFYIYLDFRSLSAGHIRVQLGTVQRRDIWMTFQEFANKLFPIIGGGNTTGEFVRTLLIQITEIPVDLDEENPLEEQLGSSFKHYFNGTRQIKELAKTINPYIEVEKFISYISSFEDGAVDNIVEEFKNDLPGVTSYTVAQQLAQLFKRILLDAVKTKRKSVKGRSVSSLKEKYGIGLVIEANCICPNLWCTNSLQEDLDDGSALNYEVFRIDESVPETENNLIALCPSCYRRLTANCTDENRNHLKSIKLQLIQNAQDKTVLSSEKLEHEIEAVLEKITYTPTDQLVPLNYEPVAVKQKIKKDVPLLIRVNAYVTAYYSKVDQWLKQMDREGKQRFKPFCNAMKINFLKLDAIEESQQKIFDSLADWIQTNTHQDRAACEIVVAYFVQKCEVFYADAE